MQHQQKLFGEYTTKDFLSYGKYTPIKNIFILTRFLTYLKKEATRRASEFRARLVKKQPSVNSWEYLGMIHEH